MQGDRDRIGHLSTPTEHHASTVKNRSFPEGRLRLLHRAATGPLVRRLRAQVIEGARLASDVGLEKDRTARSIGSKGSIRF